MWYIRYFLIVTCLVVIANVLAVEHFGDLGGMSMLVYHVDISRRKYRIYKNGYNLDISKYTHDIYNMLETKSRLLADAYVSDAYSFPKHDQVITVLPHSKNLIVLKQKDVYGYETIDDVIARIPVIGYTSKEAKELCEYVLICKGYSIDKIQFKKVKPSQIADKDIGCITMFGFLSDLEADVHDLNIEFITYDDVDIHKLKTFIPYAQFEDHDMNLYFPRYKDRFPVKRTMSFDVVVATSLDTHRKFAHEHHKFISNANTMDKNNYYNKFFKFTDTSESFLSKFNSHVNNRQDLTILEQFDESDIMDVPVVTAKNNVYGYFDSVNSLLYLMQSHIDNIPLVYGQKVVLMNQDREEELGKYEVFKVNTASAVLKKEDVSRRHHADDQFDNRYKCVGDPLNLNRGLCESDYDEMGEKKQRKTVWDRPCQTNDECPFYQANKNYLNYRGGCNDGYCELPIGMKSISYRKYDPTQKPWCHGCPKANPTCCDDQKNRKMFPHLKSPDYAFQLDDYERIGADLR